MRSRYAPPLVVFGALLVIYSLTLAPSVTLWDSGEFLAAMKTLGIPHPAGTPLFILVGKCWTFLLAPIFGFARAANLLSAVATAAACAIIASRFTEWTHDARAGICAGIIAGAMSTVWLSATETEVYALAFLLGCVLLWAADRCGKTGESRWALLVVYLAGLAWSLHLATLVVLPAAALLLFAERDGSFRLPRGRRSNYGRRAYQSPARLAVFGVLLLLVGASCVAFLLIRAKHDPAINQGNPSTLASLWDVITRRQYGDRSLWPRSAPLYLQIGNLFEYGDWQVALGVSSDPGPSFWRTTVTLAFAALGVYGSIWHRRLDKRTWRAWLALLVVGSLGVILYLNMKTGPSFGVGFVPEGNHEARERDYFFFFAFAAWAGWAGLGAARLAKRLPTALAATPFAIAVIPVIFNWSAVNRNNNTGESAARDLGLAAVQDLPRNAVMLSIGDNDTYPIWYLQQVEGVRRDVTVVTVPLLSASWYRSELSRRYRLLPPDAASHWLGAESTIKEIESAAAAQNRPVSRSPFFK